MNTLIQSLTITITSVNDAPLGTSKTIAIVKNSTYTFTVADFGFSDKSDSPASTLLSVKITTLPSLGSLTNNGVTVTAGTFIAAADIAVGKLKYAPAKNGTGANYTTLKFQVKDSGGTANGGIDLDPAAKTLTFAVS